MPDGVHMYSDGTATFYNHGAIVTEVDAMAQEGASIGSRYYTYASNDGSIAAVAGPDSYYGVTALYAYSNLGDVVVVNQARRQHLRRRQLAGSGHLRAGLPKRQRRQLRRCFRHLGERAGAGHRRLRHRRYREVYNAGNVEVSSGPSTFIPIQLTHGIGLEAFSNNSNAYADNVGSIVVVAENYAIGASAATLYGDTAMVSNAGDIVAASEASDCLRYRRDCSVRGRRLCRQRRFHPRRRL
jgi:hypothetical protein